MAIRGATRDRVISALRARTPFRNSTGSMRGVNHSEGTGYLDPVLQELFRTDAPTFIVYSYATPIAWVTRTGLVRVPAASYSMTTSQHQGLCRVYLAD